MALEQQINSAVEAATAQLAGQFRERLESLAAELSQAATAAHTRELEEALARVTTFRPAIVETRSATTLDLSSRMTRLSHRPRAPPIVRVEQAGEHIMESGDGG